MQVVYYPFAGSMLGAVRDSKYIGTDGDVDIYVDMPQHLLINELQKRINIGRFTTSGNIEHVKAETHWSVSGCPQVHMVFNDWIGDESIPEFGRATYNSTCTCLMNSVPLSCHNESVFRTWLQYGPSWRVPLHAKALDMPELAYQYNDVVRKLKWLTSSDGVIREDAVRALDKSIQYADDEMEMILIQLNVLQALIKYMKRTRDYGFY